MHTYTFLTLHQEIVIGVGFRIYCMIYRKQEHQYINIQIKYLNIMKCHHGHISNTVEEDLQKW